MKYIKLFESWLLNEAEVGTKLFNDFTIGDFRGSSDKAGFLKEFLQQFTFVPENKKTIESGKSLELIDVKVNEFEYEGSSFKSSFYEKDTLDENEKAIQAELKEAFTEEELKKFDKDKNGTIEFSDLFMKLDVQGVNNKKLENYESLLSKYEGIQKKFSELKSSKILPVLEKDIERIKKKIEYIGRNYPNGKGTEVIVELNLQLKASGAWESNEYRMVISKGLADSTKNPDGSKLTEFKVDLFTPKVVNPDEKIETTTLGNIGIWLDNAVRSFKSNTALLKQDKGESQAMYANILKDVKQYTAKLNKSKTKKSKTKKSKN